MSDHILSYIKDTSKSNSDAVYTTSSKFKTLNEKQKEKVYNEYKKFVGTTNHQPGDIFNKALSLLGVESYDEQFSKDDICTIKAEYPELDVALYNKWLTMIGSSAKQIKTELLQECFLSKVDHFHEFKKILIQKDFNYINRNQVYGHMRSDTRYEPDITVFCWIRTDGGTTTFAIPFEALTSFVQHTDKFDIVWNEQYIARRAKVKIELFLAGRIDNIPDAIVETAIKNKIKTS